MMQREAKANGFEVDHAICNGLLLVWSCLMHEKLGQMYCRGLGEQERQLKDCPELYPEG